MILSTYVKQGLIPRVVAREQAAHIVRTLGGSVYEFFQQYNRRDQYFDTRDIENFLGV